MQEGILDFFIIPRVKVHKHTKSIYMYIQADLRRVNIFSPLILSELITIIREMHGRAEIKTILDHVLNSLKLT